MNITNIERIKFYFLIFIVLLSIFQVGIIWNYQNHGIPLNFKSLFFLNKDTSNVIEMKEFFKPYRIITSKGLDEPHFILSENGKLYEKVWEDAKGYISQLLKSNKKCLSKNDFSKNEWGEIITKASFIFEFKSLIPLPLVSSFLGTQDDLNDQIKGIYKIVILPFEDLNNNVILYIFDGSKIFKYSLMINEKSLSRDEYLNMMEELETDKSRESYKIIKEIIPDESKALFEINQEIPFNIENKSKDINNLVCSIPEVIKSNDYQKNSELIKISNFIIKENQDSFDYGVDVNGVAVFKNINNYFKVNKSGYFEYKYIEDTETKESLNLSNAFQKALEFINERKGLIPKVSIFLSGIEDHKDKKYYTFSFDYKIGDYPILFNNYGKTNFNSAITISSDSKRVIYCKWFLREFTMDKELLKISTSFSDVLEDIFNSYKSLDYNKLSIEDINISYVVDTEQKMQIVKPIWVVNSKDKQNYIISVREKRR